MGYSECIVCDKCGKHATMSPSTKLVQPPNTWFSRIPVGWFVYRNHSVENIDMQYSVYCSKLCVQQGV